MAINVVICLKQFWDRIFPYFFVLRVGLKLSSKWSSKVLNLTCSNLQEPFLRWDFYIVRIGLNIFSCWPHPQHFFDLLLFSKPLILIWCCKADVVVDEHCHVISAFQVSC